ncbi:MAG TPA: ureidoglycolate lyase [Hellea balneolensis]|uniref:Ureidoglycolate lyase n=1 Tax=Hellea balneolensis TaxID=287478 RepID=A0A7C5M0L0_9PROT|nr:ureidoglycolate lyase [Hellea balneolensis]
MTQMIRPQLLSAENFAPFGDVIETRGHGRVINYGQTERFHDLARIDTQKEGGRPLVNIFRSTPLSVPIKIEILERHPLSSQAFIPLSANPFLVVVAPPGPLDESGIAVFQARSDQGVNYRAGTWHHYSLALNGVSDFLVIDRGGVGDNCDEVRLKHPFLIAPIG